MMPSRLPHERLIGETPTTARSHAEAADYLAAGLLFQPRNDRFVSLDEITTVLGMEPDSREKLRERFVVTHAIGATAPTSIRTIRMTGLARQMPEAAQSDGLTRSADVEPSALEFDVELRVARNREQTARAYCLSIRIRF